MATAKSLKNPMVFVGDPNDGYSGPPAITFKGVRFVRGRVTEVPDDKIAAVKASNHFATPEAYEEIADRLAAASEREARRLDSSTAEDSGPGRPARGRAPVGRGASKKAQEDDKATGGDDLDGKNAAQLHGIAAEEGVQVEGNATEDQLKEAIRQGRK